LKKRFTTLDLNFEKLLKVVGKSEIFVVNYTNFIEIKTSINIKRQ
jgi:hypothetical protein